MNKPNKQKAKRLPYRRRTTMEILDCSLQMVKRLETEGKLTKVRLGTRDVHHPAEEVEALAEGGRDDG